MTTAIYARQSLDRDGLGAAVDRQIEDCKKLAALREVEVAHIIVDNDVSATKGPRPGWKSLLALIESGEVDTVIVWHTDRLYRRLPDAVAIVVLAEAHNLTIWTVRAGDIDLSTPTGRGIAIMMAAAARMEVEHKGDRQRAANQKRAKTGSLHFAQRPYGYERVSGDIRIVEDEAAIVRESVGRVIAGESWYAVAKDLRARGVVGVTGVPFSYQNLMQRCTNPIYAGIRTYLGDVVNESGDWPAILDRETWDRLQTVSENRRRGPRGWDSKIKYLGSRIYRCGKCGGRMLVNRDFKGSSRPVYQCENLDTRRNLEKVDSLVVAVILDRLSQPDVLTMLTPSVDVSALATESVEIRGRLDGLASLYADGVLTAAAVREQKQRLQERLDGLQGRLGAIEGGKILGDLVTARSVEKFWNDSMTIKAKRQVLDALVSVTIMPTKRGGNNAFRPEDVSIELRSPTA